MIIDLWYDEYSVHAYIFKNTSCMPEHKKLLFWTRARPKIWKPEILHLHWANVVRNSENIYVVEILQSLNHRMVSDKFPHTHTHTHTHLCSRHLVHHHYHFHKHVSEECQQKYSVSNVFLITQVPWINMSLICIWDSILRGARCFPLFPSIQPGPQTQPASYSMGTGRLFLRC